MSSAALALTDAQVENSVRTLREPLFDTYTLAKNTATPLKIILFGDQANSGKGTSYPEKTNLTQATTLPQPERQEVYKIRLTFIGMLAADVISFCQQFVMRLWVSGTRRLTLPLAPSNEARVIATIASDVLTHSKIEFDLPEEAVIDIQAGKPFRVEFEGSAGFTTTNTNGLGIFLRVELDGFHSTAL